MPTEWYDLFLWAKEQGMYPGLTTTGAGQTIASVFSSKTLSFSYGTHDDPAEALRQAITRREEAEDALV